MICPNPNCKSIIPANSKFCPDCGTEIVSVEEIRSKVKDIVSKYKNGYMFFVNNGTLPRFVYNSTIENCQKIVSKENDIVLKHKEILHENNTGRKFNCVSSNANEQANADQTKFITCPHCDAKILSCYKFCIECGKGVNTIGGIVDSVNRLSSPKYSNGSICRKCNANIPDDSKFCPDCGTPVKNEEELRRQAKEIVSMYPKGYDNYVKYHNLPHFVYNLKAENCEKIVAKKQEIIKKHNEILQEEKRIKEEKKIRDIASGITITYAKAYNYYVKIGILPRFVHNLDIEKCKQIIVMKNDIIKKHNEIETQEKAIEEHKKNNSVKIVGIHYTDGSRYEGDILQGVPHGKGTMYYSCGDRYEGYFNNGKREGYGTYYWSNGSSRSNEWKNDVEIFLSTPYTTENNEESPFLILFGILVIIGSLFAIIFFIRSLLIDFNII